MYQTPNTRWRNWAWSWEPERDRERAGRCTLLESILGEKGGQRKSAVPNLEAIALWLRKPHIQWEQAWPYIEFSVQRLAGSITHCWQEKKPWPFTAVSSSLLFMREKKVRCISRTLSHQIQFIRFDCHFPLNTLPALPPTQHTCGGFEGERPAGWHFTAPSGRV